MSSRVLQPKVRIMSRDELKQSEMRKRFPWAEYYIGDVRDYEAVRRAMSGCDGVIHAAALKQVGTSELHVSEFVQTNVLGTQNVSRAMWALGCDGVLLSSDKAVEPVNAYGATKLLAERIWLSGEWGCAVCRYGNVVGSRGSLIPRLLDRPREFTLTSPDATRFWIGLQTVAGFILDTLEALIEGHVPPVNIPAMKAMTVMDVAKTLSPETKLTTGKLPAYEKMHEILGDGQSSETAPRLTPAELWEMVGEMED
jgi:UDP-N-acetylglucosamine 4,6-dehydratase